MSKKIFISYRREDSQWPADRLYAAIKPLLPDPEKDIFIDVDNIPLGVNFAQHLDSKVAQCDVLLALIGKDWLDVRNPATGARRLDDPGDFVRIELAAALKRGISVVPVFIDGATAPAAGNLPDDLKALSLQNGADVRRTSFDADAEKLIKGLGLDPGKKKAAAAGWRNIAISVGAAAVVAGVISVVLWAVRPVDEPYFGKGPVSALEANNAIKQLDIKWLQNLLRRGWDPNAPLDKHSDTSLNILVNVCNANPGHDRAKLTEVARFLVNAGADRRAKNEFGETAWFTAGFDKYCGPNHPVIEVLKIEGT